MNLFPSTRTDYVLFNEKRTPFNDVHVRRAMSLAIDRQALVKAVLFGNGKPANSVFPPQVPYYQAATQGLQLNVSQAKAEMAKSSQPHGFSTTFLIPSGESDDSTIAQIIQSDVAPLGIKIKIQQLDQNTVNTDQQGLNYDMSLSYWTMDIPDPDELATFAVDPKSGAKSFYTDYDNPAVVSAVHAAEKTLSTTGRQALYNKVQTQSAADAFMAFLYYSPYAYAASSKLHGFYVTPLGNYHLENAWLSK
jgi:peptide/nickel transport system substrate-binding protein